ncbi:hypothetical protein DLAC_04532 [Tieghemostelium lacteum]|uniref:RGS domain-containing protein n=1 Tax=Tieghemostelium lacteum TaxID=361077 RepID=A0A151ZJR1_TIELA|nr:hypothetical protein DLAC_04532 [Tieghemostelium lacteum]|eukprot:KYQ94238.1 hypothetical protein DLAC_04532 [Tieghemostelium lacteum]
MAFGLDQIVQDKNLALIFRKFLYERYNNENFSFWLEAENFKYLTSSSQTKDRCKEIYEKYFSASSKYELNIDSFQRKELDEKIKAGTINNDIFLAIQNSIRKLLEMDAIPLFTKSEQYKKYNDTKTIDIDLSERDRSVTIVMMEEFFKNRLKNPKKE